MKGTINTLKNKQISSIFFMKFRNKMKLKMWEKIYFLSKILNSDAKLTIALS